MKIKGIPFWEQHVEKFILAGFGVVLLGVGAWQVLLRPTDITLENKPAGPDEIEAALKARAEAVSAKLGSGAGSAPLVEGKLPLAMSTFPAALDGGVSPRTTLPTVAPSLAAAILPSEAASSDDRFYEPSMKAPTMVTVRQESDTLEETALTQFPELAEIYKDFAQDPTRPRDITWLVPVAEVDVAAMRAELRKSMANDKPPILAIPALWFNDALWLVDVQFQRQERKADGSWSEPTLIATLPNQFTFRKEIPTANVDLRDEMYRLLVQSDKVLSILQPDFLPTKGDTFSAGLVLGAAENAAGKDGDAKTDPDTVKLNRLKQNFARKQIERDRTAEQVKDLGGPCEPPPKTDDRKKDNKDNEDSGKSGGGRGAPGGGGLGGGGMPGGKNKGQPKEKEDLDKCIRLTRRLKALENELEKLQDDIKRLSPSESLAGSQKGRVDLAKDAKLLVWGHDITVKPGATYRYTCRIDSYNPFFGRKRQLIPQQQNLSNPFILASAVSAPSAPVTVEPPVAIFVTEASSNGGRLGMGKARVELYRFFDGVRRAETMEVQPGDRIGKVVEKKRDGGPSIDFTTDWFVVDIVDDGASDRNGGEAGVHVLLRRVNDEGIVVRDPLADEASAERTRFEEEAQAVKAPTPPKAEGSDEPPASGGGAKAPGGGGAGPGGK